MSKYGKLLINGITLIEKKSVLKRLGKNDKVDN